MLKDADSCTKFTFIKALLVNIWVHKGIGPMKMRAKTAGSTFFQIWGKRYIMYCNKNKALIDGHFAYADNCCIIYSENCLR